MDKDNINPYSIAGIPVCIDPFVPEGEIWMVQEGVGSTVHIHEGPQPGEDVTVWLSKPRVHRIVNLGKWWEIPKVEFNFEKK